MSNSTTPTSRGSGLSMQCVGCLVVGLIIGLFAGAILPTLFQGQPIPTPAPNATGTTVTRGEESRLNELAEEAEEHAADEEHTGEEHEADDSSEHDEEGGG